MGILAVGDIISEVYTVAQQNTQLFFQPAAAVEIMILAITGQNANFTGGLYDGTDAARSFFSVSTSSGNKNNCNIKMGITNTHYLNIYFDGQGGYTGIQIK